MTEPSSYEVRIHHGFPLHRLDADAVWIVRRLTGAGHLAYLVGGCIRDLLTRLPPKDFDIATSARPNQIKRLFHNCWIIGRRFRLAHVRFGSKTIEVSTFRGMAQENGARSDEWGPIRDDNVFGAPDEDAMRRDFTINGLFYDVSTGEIIDYVGGLTDLRRRVIRSIGDPEARMIEDPVRMIRALKFAARVDFSIDPPLAGSIRRHHAMIAESSPARVLEELFKILGSGASSSTFRLLADYGLLHDLLPEVSRWIDGRGGDGVYRSLHALDALDQGQRRHPNAVLLGALVMPLIDPTGRLARGQDGTSERSSVLGDAGLALERLVRGSSLLCNLPRKDLHRLGQTLSLIRRMSLRDRISPRRVVDQPEFFDALALLNVANDAMDHTDGLAHYWEQRAVEYPPAPFEEPGSWSGDDHRSRGRRPRRRRSGGRSRRFS